MEESIYNLIPKGLGDGGADGSGRQNRGPRYKSQHAERVRKEASKGKADAALMGKKADVSPDKFLRKGQGPRATVDPEPRQPKSASSRKPRVPRRDEQPVMGVKSNKNYVTQNAIENITAVPKRRAKEEEQFSKKSDFGKVPEYLVQRRQEEQERVAATQRQIQELKEANGLYRIPEQEKQELLRGLKANYDLLHKAYLNLPVMVDTANKKAKKLAMEQQLAELESDIDKFERHSAIFVADY